MRDLLIMVIFAIIAYVFYKWMLKEPILPWMERPSTDNQKAPLKKRGRTKKHEVEIEQEPQLFEELFTDIKDISHHMIRFNDNSFTMITEVDPVNYFLKSQDEQEAIDIVFESWLATINYPVSWYFQNRFIDISEPIEAMNKSMKNAEDLNEAALSFGQSMINDLLRWQAETPRYETKRYLLFTHKINPSEVSSDSKEELEERIQDKAFSELLRRMNAAKSQLRKAEISVSLLPTEGIYELLYHTFNRRKAVKQRFKDMTEQEKNALYITADQPIDRIETVKEVIEEHEAQKERAS